MADRTESTIVIDATSNAILEVIADLAAYPQWSEGITSVEVLETEKNRPTLARFVLDAGIIKDTPDLLDIFLFCWTESYSIPDCCTETYTLGALSQVDHV